MRFSRFVSLICLLGLPIPVLAFQVFTCEPEWASLARVLVPEAKVISATHAGQDPHHIEARPSLIAALRRADIAVCTGASLEVGWLPALQARAANPAVLDGAPAMFYAAEHTSLIEQRESVDRSEGDVHPEGNPHFHFDPERLLQVAGALAKRLAELIPDSAAEIGERHAAFEAGWRENTARWRAAGETLAGRSVVVQHSAYTYLLNFLGVDVTADLEPLPGLPPTVGHLNDVLEKVRSDQPIAILQTPYQLPQGGRWLAERSGLPLLVLPATATDAQSPDSLRDSIDRVVTELVNASR